jgi:hypothetical protein
VDAGHLEVLVTGLRDIHGTVAGAASYPRVREQRCEQGGPEPSGKMRDLLSPVKAAAHGRPSSPAQVTDAAFT